MCGGYGEVETVGSSLSVPLEEHAFLSYSLLLLGLPMGAQEEGRLVYLWRESHLTQLLLGRRKGLEPEASMYRFPLCERP